MTSNSGSCYNKCQIDFEDLDEVNQESTMEFSVRNSTYKNVEEIYSVLKAYFSNSRNVLMNTDAYFEYISQIPKTFSMCVKSDPLLNSVTNKEEKYMNLQIAGICLKILHLCLENPLTIEALKLIIQTSLSVLYDAYTHCKDSETFYGDLFDEFTNELGIFYKYIQNVQNTVLKCLDELISSDNFNTEVEFTEIKSITNDVGKLCELLICLDRIIAAVFWKTFIKLISKYKDILLEKLQIETFLSPLISDVENIVNLCVHNIEFKEQIDETEIKLCLVETSTIKKIVEIFKNNLSKEAIVQLRNFTLTLNKLLILCHSSTASEGKDLNVIKILLKTIPHVIMPFYADKLFFLTTLQCKPEEITPDSFIPLVLLKLSVIGYVKSSNDCIELLQNGKILMEIFSTLILSKPEDDLKLVSIKIPLSFVTELKDGNDELLSIHQHCYLCLTECSKHISEPLITIDEFIKNLLHTFNSCSDVIFLLISDVWIFYARYGSIGSLYKKCKVILELLEKVNANSRIELLLRRMFKFLPQNYKAKIFDMHGNLHKLFCSHSNFYRFDSPQHTSSSPMEKIKCVQINFLMRYLKESDSRDLQKMIQRACSILKLGALCIEIFSPCELLKFIEFCATLFETEIYEIQAGILMFLKALGGKVLSRNQEELKKLTSTVAELLSSSLKSKNYIIRIDAFNVYFCLAQTTPHSDMIRKTVINSPSLVPSVKAYAEKKPSNGFLSDEEKCIMLKDQLKKFSESISIQTIPPDAENVLHSLLT